MLRLMIGRCALQKLYSTNHAPKVFGLSVEPDPHHIDCDYIGPVNKESNLRDVVRHIPKNETPLQKQLRTRRISVHKWNTEFWTNHNKRFYEEKEEFIALHKPKDVDTLSADKMSEFYKAFLDKNWRMHFYYNLSWYIKNIELLFLALRVNIQSLYKRN